MLLSGSFVKVVVCPGFVLCDFSMTINVEMNYPLIGKKKKKLFMRDIDKTV